MLAMAEFAIESIIRQSLKEIINENIDIHMNDALGRLTLNDVVDKYGNTEVLKVKQFLQTQQVNIIQSLTQLANNENLPSFSIHLMSDAEDESKAGFNDFDGETVVPIAPRVIVPLFNANSYDSDTGTISVPDSADLQNVYKGMTFLDGHGVGYTISDPISNFAGNRYFTINANIPMVGLLNAQIVSSITSQIWRVKYTTTNENIMIGVHTDNALMTKYLYYVLRYILYRQRHKFQEYQMQLSKYDGSDFSLNQVSLPEAVYSRWITARFVTYNFWHDVPLKIIDAINPHIGGVGPLYHITCLFTSTNYNAATGVVTVNDQPALCKVRAGDEFFDAAGQNFTIIGGIMDALGNKQFQIINSKNQAVTVGAKCIIKRPALIKVEAGVPPSQEGGAAWISVAPTPLEEPIIGERNLIDNDNHYGQEDEGHDPTE